LKENDDTDTINLLKEFCEASGVSGYESGIAAIIQKKFAIYCDEVTTDRFGNVIALKKSCAAENNGNKIKRLMLTAHMDEIGLMVSKIDEDGFLKFTSVGGIDPRVLISQEVLIHGREKIFGVIGLKPPHLTSDDEKEKSIRMDEMAIDTGFEKETVKELIRVGDIVTIQRETVELRNNFFSGKSLDDRAGIAALLECMEQLYNWKNVHDIYYVATGQEEVGLKGALAAAHTVRPDMCVAVEVCHARFTGLDSSRTAEINKGPVISIGPNIHYSVFEALKGTAEKYEIPFQIEVLPYPSRTDANSVQISNNGVAVGLVSIPLKYMHTSVETICIDDETRTGRLLADFVRDMEIDFNSLGMILS
jgi:endoglucanase